MCYGFRDMLSNMVIVWIIPLILLFLIGISIYMIRKIKKEDDQHINNSALKILDERFAKGEIDEEEYNRKKNNLNTSK